MVALYVNGAKIGTLADAEALIPRLMAEQTAVELRDDTGKPVGTLTPIHEPLCPWDPSLTREELNRRAREPGGKSLAEILKRLGAE